MVSKQQIEYLVRRRDFSLTDAQVDMKSTMLLADIYNRRFDFSLYKREVFTQQGKKRVVFSYSKLSCEDILCQYLKKQMDSVFHVKYASRRRIMNILFNILPVVKDMNDFVIVRADFKSFFDSVLVKHVYDNYIQNSVLKRYDKELLELYTNEFKYCYAGLCLSNGMTEIVCRDFDERIKAKLSQHGIFFYERYVDDILLIMNKYISKDKFLKLIDSTIHEVFGDSPVKLATSPGKFSYIAKRNMIANPSEVISFLGYEFELNFKINNRGRDEITFKYGITEKKRRKYSGIIERAIIQYSKDKNEELLRQRIKIYSSRVVIGRTIGGHTFDWLTKGIVANYNELQYHIDALIPTTEKFLKDLYTDLMNKHNLKIMPYFLKQASNRESIYNMFSTMKRNRSIVFQYNIGVSRSTLIKWLKKLEPSYSGSGDSYYSILVKYLETIKIE